MTLVSMPDLLLWVVRSNAPIESGGVSDESSKLVVREFDDVFCVVKRRSSDHVVLVRKCGMRRTHILGKSQRAPAES